MRIASGTAISAIQRGNNCEVIFAGADDYRFYLEKLNDAWRREMGLRLNI